MGDMVVALLKRVNLALVGECGKRVGEGKELGGERGNSNVAAVH
jgi:hypothetical protein